MAENTSQKILTYIQKKRQASGKELADYLMLSDRAVRKQLKQLLETGILTKVGKPPKVYYQIAEVAALQATQSIDDKTDKIINRHHLFITPAGERIDGVAGFIAWCQKRDLPVEKAARDYIKIIEKYESMRVHGLMNATGKLRQTFPGERAVDALYYGDVYSVERFGKTKLGQLLLYAKQTQDRKLIKEVVDEVRPALMDLIEREQIDAVGFIPPTVKRTVQFMNELQRQLALDLPVYKIVKLKTTVTVPQKTLSKLTERIENARKSIVIEDSYKSANVLLIDDAAGSGATLHETAKQLRERGLVRGHVIAFAVAGSVKGFDVIQEV